VILALLYHRINGGQYSNSLQMFRSHIGHLARNFPIVIPGDPLLPGKMAVCLTFDDAYFDFYHYVYPLLSELKIRALLSVSPKYIIGSADVDPSIRLQVPQELAAGEGVYQEKVPFCTWAELTEMVESGCVEVASHSYSHRVLTERDADLPAEIAGSKDILEGRLRRAVTTFVYPYGKVDKKVHRIALQHYRYTMRIGSAMNRDWDNAHRMIYRVNADMLPEPLYPLRKRNLAKYFLKYLSNTVRGR
jgi:peptidoglycan/xylan/chitin deacetylase (PgdA/CDA1 family)